MPAAKKYAQKGSVTKWKSVIISGTLFDDDKGKERERMEKSRARGGKLAMEDRVDGDSLFKQLTYKKAEFQS